MLNKTAQKIFKMKYSRNNEEWEDTALRVASYVASAEDSFNTTEEEKDQVLKDFYSIIYGLYFVPGGRTLTNAGTGIKNLMNCFVLPVDDSRSSIYSTLKNAAEVFAWGGGVGYNFSNVREEGASIKTTGGQASGPLSFMSLFDQTGEVIQQASRRGAQMAILDVDHADIEKFINFKSTPNSRNQRLLEEYHRNLSKVNGTLKNTKYYNVLEKTLLDDQLTHFNVSVSITDDFMNKAINDEMFDLKSRLDDSVVRSIKADDLLKTIANQAWKSGDPGLFFYDRTNEDNMVPYIGSLRATNPCGEVPLLSYEPCCLGSINLAQFVNLEDNSIDFPLLEKTVRTSVRFMDNVQEISETPISEINAMSKGLRRLGLGKK